MPVPASVAPMVGRTAELEILEAHFAAVGQGAGGALLIEGEAGIGKSRLLGELFDRATGAGVRVLSGAGRELEAERPFGPIVDALRLDGSEDPDEAAILDLLHGTGATDGGIRFRIVDLIADLLERWSLETPLLLCIDDLQWADTSSLLVVDSAARQARSLPLLVVAATRPTPMGTELTALIDSLGDGSARRIALEPLDAEARLELATSFLGAEPSGHLLEKLEATGGNPLFETELLAALRQEGTLQIEEGKAEAADTALPPSLRLTILRRVGFLPSETIEALRVASVLGSAFSADHLSALSGTPPAELLGALAPALDSGVLREAGDRLAFRHDLVRDAIYEDVPASVRMSLHAEAGRRLLEAGAPAIEAAQHVLLGAARGDQHAVDILLEAARQAAPRAPASAAELLERALELLPPASDRRGEILAQLADALQWAGRPEEALESARTALAGPDLGPDATVRAAWALLYALAALGRHREASESAEQVSLRPGFPELERMRLLSSRIWALITIGDLGRAEAEIERLMPEVEGLEDTGRTTVGLTGAIANLRLHQARCPEALTLADEAVRDAISSGLFDEIAGARGLRATILIELDRTAEARAEGLTFTRLLTERGVGSSDAALQQMLGSLDYLEGAWDDAEARFEAAHSSRSTLGWAEEEDPQRTLMRFHRNEPLPKELFATPSALGDDAGVSLRRARLRALVAEAEGRIDEAGALFAALLEDSGPSPLSFRRAGPEAVRVTLAAGNRSAAEGWTRGTEDAAEKLRAPSARAAALRCRGLLDGDLDAFVAAVEAARESPRVLERALTFEDAGRALSSTRPEEAISLLKEAAGELTKMGAERHLRRVRALLREHGVQTGTGRSAKATFGWEALTESELRVVECLAEGLRNRQIAERLFLSVRTVDSHVSHALSKLGYSSRLELAAEALRRRE